MVTFGSSTGCGGGQSGNMDDDHVASSFSGGDVPFFATSSMANVFLS